MSLQNGGPKLRAAAATAYAALLDMAAKHLKVSKDKIVARDARFHAKVPGGGVVTYERLLRGADMVLKSDTAAPQVDQTTYVVVGQNVPRVDIPPKLHDGGVIVNPDGLINQIEGNIIQGISRTLKEEVLYTGDRVTSVVWESNSFNPRRSTACCA